MNKREKGALLARTVEHVFRCPICHGEMAVFELRSLVCGQNHTFDFSKHGYLNMLMRPPTSKYDKELFKERKKIMEETRFFQPLIKKILEIVSDYSKGKNDLSLIDMGCGEGSHLKQISAALRNDFGIKLFSAGIDIAKEGIREGAKNGEQSVWLVADIANAPFKDKAFDVLLNILSPSNYREFERLLKDDGILIKVIPQKNYLIELRQLFYEDEKQEYSNEGTAALFKENFYLEEMIPVKYQTALGPSAFYSLMKMTPLTWNVGEERLKKAIKSGENKITVDLEILIGKKK